jgi:hypothetical protein
VLCALNVRPASAFDKPPGERSGLQFFFKIARDGNPACRGGTNDKTPRAGSCYMRAMTRGL